MGKMLIIVIVVIMVIFTTLTMAIQKRSGKATDTVADKLDKIKAKNIGTYALNYAIKLYADGAISNASIPAPLCHFGDPEFFQYPLDTYDVMGGSIDNIFYSFADLETPKDSVYIKVEVSHGTVESYECETVIFSTLGSIPSEVGSWSFDEGAGTIAEDGSINDNDGTLENVNENKVWEDGVFGSAIHLDGKNDLVDLEEGVCSEYGDVLTIVCWVKLDQSFWDWGNLVSEQTNSVDGPIAWTMSAQMSSQIVGLEMASYLLKVNTGAGLKQLRLDIMGDEMDIYGWHFIVGTYDGTYSETQAEIKLQVFNEGFEETKIIDKWSLRDPTNNVFIGGGSYSHPTDQDLACIDGCIDEVKLFDTILTHEQLSDLYNFNGTIVNKIVYWSDNSY